MTELDVIWARVLAGDRDAFGDWMGRVERPIRLSLWSYASAVDVEAVMQETLARMWLFARERGEALSGDDASLRWGIRMARNLARNMARKHQRDVMLPPEDMPEPVATTEPSPDPSLRRAIAECFARLVGKPLAALRARLADSGGQDDRTLAAALGMTLNTFLQNIVRARRQLRACLADKGIDVEEYLT